MKTTSLRLVGYLMAAAGALCVGWVPAWADGSGEVPPEVDIWQDALVHPFDSITLTEPQIERFLGRLSQTAPDRAAELEKMRLAHPRQFRWEIREEMANRFFRHIQSDQQRKPDTPPSPPSETVSEPDEAAVQKYNELVAWLEVNFPRQAEALKADGNPDGKRVDDLFMRYEPVMRAERAHPKLAEAMKEDIQLQMRRDELLLELQSADPDEREPLERSLQELVERRFDLIVLKRELQHDHLRRRLNHLQKELDAQQGEMDKLKRAKDQSVHVRVKALVQNATTADVD